MAYSHDDYAWYKAHGTCTRCHTAAARPRRILCESCEEREKAYRKKHADRRREYMRVYMAEYRRRRAEDGRADV